MVLKIGINGFNEISRSIIIEVQKKKYNNIEIILINSLFNIHYLFNVLKFDIINNFLNYNIFIKNDKLLLNNKFIICFFYTKFNLINLNHLNIDVIIDCNGNISTYKQARIYLISNVKKVIIASFTNNDIETIIYGINEYKYFNQNIISTSLYIIYYLVFIIKYLITNYNIFNIKINLFSTILCYTNFSNLFLNKNFYKNNYNINLNLNINSFDLINEIYKLIPEIKNKIKILLFNLPILKNSFFDLTICFKENIIYTNFLNILKKKLYFDFKSIEYFNYNIFSTNKFFCFFQKSNKFVNKNFLKLIFSCNNLKFYSGKILSLISYIFN